MKRKLLRWVLKLSGDSWQMSTGSVPWPDCTWKQGLTVCACIALNLHISRFEPSGAVGNWFKVGCSRYGDQTISDSVQHQDPAASSSLLEWIQLQLLQHGCHASCPSVITTGETCSVPLNQVDFVDVAFDTVVPYWWCVHQLRVL